MKKLLIPGLFALTLISSAFAAPVSESNAHSHFAAYFSNAKDVTWKVTDRFEKATSTIDGVTTDVFYDNNGDLLGTSKTMAFDKLPKAAIETITTKYTFPAYKLKECIEFKNADGDKNYYVSFQTATEKVVLEITTAGSVSVMPKSKS